MDDARFLASVLLLVAADADDLGQVAVGSAELERALLPVGEDAAAVLLDLLGGGLAVLDLDADVMDAGTGPGELRLLLLLAVVDHQGEVDIAVGHVPRDVAAGMAGLGLVDAEHVLVELGRLFQIFDLEGDVHDAGHGALLFTRLPDSSRRVADLAPRYRGFGKR